MIPDYPDNLPEEIKEALRALAIKRQRPVICLCGEMDPYFTQEVRNAANQLKESDNISVLLDSPGGSIDDAYRMVLALREHAKDVEVLVPRWAKSAATFFCLAAENVYLGQYGELGPIDPQILTLRGSTIPISALESFQALDQLLKYSMDSFDVIVQQLLDRAPLDVPYAIEQAQPLFAAIVSPLYSKVDLHELSATGRYLAISEEYAVRVMQRWGYPELGYETIRQIARHLVWNYPTHGFVIDLAEAQAIGLKAERLDSESEVLCHQALDRTQRFIGVEFPESDQSRSRLEHHPEPHEAKRGRHGESTSREIAERE